MKKMKKMKLKKARVAIIGTGNIGADLLVKINRSPYLECTLFAGRNLHSKGMLFAKQLGTNISDKSIDAFIENPDICDIVMDATSASCHLAHAPVFRKLGLFTIDLTPSNVGEMCVPVINRKNGIKHDNVNLITCGGQAIVPIAYAISNVCPDVQYFEVAASISSKSAGPGTRANIDEFTSLTKTALIKFTGVENAKAIIVLNPAEPPITMHNTLYSIIDKPDMDKITKAVNKIADEIKKYVPGFVCNQPILEHGRVVTMVSVNGNGDYLPPYSGNLDVITCAAVDIAETHVKEKML